MPAMQAEPGPVPPSAVLRVASYNIHRAVGTDSRRDPARIAAVLREIDADILGLQEVDWQDRTRDGETQFEYLADMPGYCAVAGPNIRDHRGHYGNVMLSRLNVGRVRRIDLSAPEREPRGAIEAEIGLDGAALRVIVTHLGLGLRERRRQAVQLRAMIAEQPVRPTVLLGDFNDWLPGSPTLRPLLASCVLSGRPASYPSFCPVLALDRVFACALPSPPEVRVHDTRRARKASDHLPVVAAIDLAGLRRPAACLDRAPSRTARPRSPS